MDVQLTVKGEEVCVDTINWIKEYATNHLKNIFDRILEIEIVVEQARVDHHDGHKVSLLVDVEHDQLVLHEENDSDLQVVFMQAVGKMKRKIRKYKERIQDHHK